MDYTSLGRADLCVSRICRGDDELRGARESPVGAIGRRAGPIVGATILSHVEDAIAAVELTVSEEEIRRLQEPYRPHAIAGQQ